MKAYIETYGCTANHSDSQRIEQMLRTGGYEIVEDDSAADLLVVNTCTVIERTELNVLRRLEELSARNILVAGCMPAAQPELIQSTVGDVKMITPADIDQLPLLLNLDMHADYKVPSKPTTDGVVSAVSISDGCVGRCSYCIVKLARGELRSYPPEKIASSVKSLVDSGVKEVRITSQDTASYGLDMDVRLSDLLGMLADMEGDFCIRVGMMNPSTAIDIADELVEVFRSPKVFKFLHLPVQSGSDLILERMHRNYTASDFLEIVNVFRKSFPDMVLSTDFIVGFPGETDADHRMSMGLLAQIRATKVNITRFSSRPGTAAEKMSDVLSRVKKERSRDMTLAYHRIALEENQGMVGTQVKVLVTEKGTPGSVITRDQNYNYIVIKEELPPGERFNVEITDAKTTYLLGEVC